MGRVVITFIICNIMFPLIFSSKNGIYSNMISLETGIPYMDSCKVYFRMIFLFCVKFGESERTAYRQNNLKRCIMHENIKIFKKHT